jgi:AraC-like DNA-binding protein
MSARRALSPVDPLGDAMHGVRMSRTLCCRSELTSPWGIDVPAMGGFLMFHFVVTGRCWLGTDGGANGYLEAGELALLPRGEGHAIASDPAARRTPLFDLPRDDAGERYELLRHGGGGEPTVLICGAVGFDDPSARRLVHALPDVLRIPVDTGANDDWLRATVHLMTDEARALRPGSDTVVTRLADVLVMQAIQAWFNRAPAVDAGWVGGLRDRQIGRALALIHRDPAHDWSVTSLANASAMSRPAFAARFRQVVGMPPMRYVTVRRIELANELLAAGISPLARVAARVGYESEAAFSRAFKRATGVSPSTVARRSPARPRTT